MMQKINNNYIPATIWAESRPDNHDVMFYVLSKYSGTNKGNNLYANITYYFK